MQARAKPLQPREWQELLCNSQLICPADSPAQQSSASGATAVAPGQARGAAAGLKRSAGSRPGQDLDTAAAVDESKDSALGANQQQPVLLDLRNGYEWDAGHFQGAARPLEVRTLRCAALRDECTVRVLLTCSRGDSSKIIHNYGDSRSIQATEQRDRHS